MKKILTIILILSVMFAVACNGESGSVNNSSNENSFVSGSGFSQGGDSSSEGTSQGGDSSSEGTSQGGSSSFKNSSSQGGSSSSGSSSSQSESSSSESSSSQGGSSSSENSSSQSGSSSVVDPDKQEPLKDDISDPQKPAEYDYNYTNGTFGGTGVRSDAALFSSCGYASGVTGGGVLSENDAKYYKVTTALEFISAINRKNPDDKNDDAWYNTPTVIEVMNDIDLGYNVIGAQAQALADVVQANEPSYHPTLKKTGVSLIYITGRQNLTIFSKNGYSLKHACFQIRGGDGGRESSNIIIRNLKFIGAWEWDDSGNYDNNDWDVFTLRADKGDVKDIWFDHCTFTKPYDGTIDVKYHATDITISWCAFIPYTTSDSDFMDMMNYLENNRSMFANYSQARNAGASFEDMVEYATINKKVHLVGHSDNNTGDENIRITYANNYYYNCTERLPRLRLGKAHVYNCIFNAERANNIKIKLKSLGGWPSALGFDANGSLGTNYGELLLENCYINGINCPLRNNNKKAEDQYTGKCEALTTYYTCLNIDRSWSYDSKTNSAVSKNGRYTFFGSSTADNAENLLKPFPMQPLSFDTDAFKTALPYDYVLFNPLELYLTQNGRVGAGKMDFSPALWMTANYKPDSFENKIAVNGVDGKSANMGLSRL